MKTIEPNPWATSRAAETFRSTRRLPMRGKVPPVGLALAVFVLLTLSFPQTTKAITIDLVSGITTRDDPWEAFFPNEYDPSHPAELRFEGVATVGGDPTVPLPALLWVQFDWVDPILGVIYSPPWSFPLYYTPTVTPIDISWTVDFCPEQVSLHFATDAPHGAVVAFAGDFSHGCVPDQVPDTGSTALLGVLGMLGLCFCRSRAAVAS